MIYQIGLCYYEQVDTVDRDQVSASKALETFQRLSRQFPDNPYRNQIEDHIRRCLKSLAGHELYVGLYYYKAKHYEAALNRFKTILSRLPGRGGPPGRPAVHRPLRRIDRKRGVGRIGRRRKRRVPGQKRLYTRVCFVYGYPFQQPRG